MGAYLAIKSKNLLPISPVGSYTVAGIKVTNNGDGSFTFNGTCTAEFGYKLWNLPSGSTDTDTLLPNGVYSASVGADFTQTTLTLFGTCANNVDIVYARATPKSFGVATVGIRITAVGFYFFKGATYDNVTVYPMLVEGSYTSATMPAYEPYYTYKRVKALTPVDKPIATPIKDYTFPYAGLTYIAKDNVVTFGGENNSIGTRSKAFSAFNKNSWYENYVMLYKLRNDDIDIEAGRYTISFNADIVTGNAVYIACGSVGTNKESGTIDYYAEIIPNSNYKGVVSHTFEVAKGTKLALLLHTSNDSVGLCTVSNFLLIKHEIKKCTLRMRPTIFPARYQRVEYIESTGTQWIDTGFKPNQDTRVICRAKVPVSNETNFLFGARESGSAKMFGFCASGAGNYLTMYNISQPNWDKALNSAGVITVDMNQNTTTITTDSLSKSHTIAKGEFTAPCNLVLAGCNTNGSVTGGRVVIYSCQVYDNGKLVRDFIPCYRRDDDSVIGLFDIVSGVFFTNQGTGTFSKGANV